MLRSYWIKAGPESDDWFPYVKRRGHTHRGGSVTMDSKIGVRQPQAKEGQKLLGATRMERNQETFFPRDFRGSMPC